MNDHHQELQYDPTAYPRHPSTCARIHPLHDPSLDDPLADRQSQSQPQNPNPTPPPTIRMEAHIRLCEADQLPVRLIPLHTDYRNLLLILRCTATTLVEDLSTCILLWFVVRRATFRANGW